MLRVGDRVTTPKGEGVVDYIRSNGTAIGVKLDSAKYEAAIFLAEVVAKI